MRIRLGIAPFACLCITSLFLLSGCQPASRYPSFAATKDKDKNAPPVSQDYGWINETSKAVDVPIVFVDATTHPKEWQQLVAFWNRAPIHAGRPTVHFGLSPIEAIAALALAGELDVIKIKVPLGLPRPITPSANPPTLAKWNLGKKLFFAKDWLYRTEEKSCADCHRPTQGFTSHDSADFSPFNPPSLINSAYNRHLFWDGRVTELEQTLAQKLDDERAPSQREKFRHVWPGAVGSLRASTRYSKEFEAVFGRAPTQDNLGKALATYMRTILSGSSLYDKAQEERLKEKSDTLEARHFEAAAAKHGARPENARAAHKGYQLFHGKARCSGCHNGPLFTDADFHNLGVEIDDRFYSPPKSGKETGRFGHLPIGLKEQRLIGAYRTPTLRALPRTGPYFHNGYKNELQGVLDFYAKELDARGNIYLAPLLRSGTETARSLELDAAEFKALEQFLRSLDGDEIPTIISGVEKK
jgi:cytochrome c peroxidase